MKKITIPIRAMSVNRVWQGRRFKTKEYKQYEEDVAMLLPKLRYVPQGYVSVKLVWYMKNWKRVDVDNPVKPLLDILVKCGVLDDDRMVKRLVVEKEPADKGDYIEVEIEELKGE